MAEEQIQIRGLETIVATLEAMCENRARGAAFGELHLKILFVEGRIKEGRFIEETIIRPVEPPTTVTHPAPKPPPAARRN